MPADLPVTARLVIPGDELEETFTTSSGPGGQHVNRSQTRAVLRWDLAGSRVLAPDVVARLRTAAGSRLTRDGQLVLTCGRQRSQASNLAEVRERLADLVRGALRAPVLRRSTRASARARRRRREGKRRRGQIKRLRGKVRGDE